MIHKTAIIDSEAKIAENVKIGPYTVIGPNVEIGQGTVVQSHVNITGQTKIGKNNSTVIKPFILFVTPQLKEFSCTLFQSILLFFRSL